LNNITYLLLFFFILLSTKAYSLTDCNNADINNACIQVMVKNKTGELLKDVVVYLEPLDGQILAKQSEKVIISQVDKSFAPYISVSQVNSDVSFANKDNITHHIYSVGGDNNFSFKVRAGETNSSPTFGHTAEVAMGCNIHDWMSGYLLVVNTPYFDKTDEQGVARFNITEKGSYNVIVWHPQMQSENNRIQKKVIVSASAVISFQLNNQMADIPLQENDEDFDFLSDY